MVRFELEPWGEQYEMPPGANFTIVAKASTRGELEIQVAEDRITVFGWTGSTIEIFQNGKELK
jgi:hypothetical protein